MAESFSDSDPNRHDEGESFSFKAGAKIGDLTLIRELGRGGQAVVFEARQETLDRRVAVKILSRDYVNSDSQAARFRREAEATGRLSHPGIVAVYDYREVEGHPLIVQELLEGQNLAEQLEDRWSEIEWVDTAYCDWAADVVRQLALALQHAHDHQVIHRDVKPQNVLMGPDGAYKVADFGLAKVDDKVGLSLSGTILGTPHYMSPEQVEGGVGNPVDGRSDVYSLGAVLYRMLTDRVPVKARSLEGVFLDILHRMPTPPRNIQSAIHRDLEAVCLKALEKAPRNRYQSAQEMAEDLEKYLSREPTTARPVGAFVRTLRSLSRLATSTLGVLAILVPALWFLVDVFVMSPLGTESPVVIGIRLGVVAVAAALLSWPLSVITIRWSGGRPWAVALAILIAVGLGVTAGWRVLEQRLHRLHLEARDELALAVELADRRDADDVQNFIDLWGDRFEDDDLFLVARAYLSRGRGGQAEQWVRRGQQETTAPVYAALLDAVAVSTGSDDTLTSARVFDDVPEDTAWSEWKRIGDVLRLMRRYSEARRAYELSGSADGADRDLVNLSLARVLTDLCRWEAADERLRDVLHWRPDDPEANLLARRIAFARLDLDAAQHHVRIAEKNPKTPLLVRLQRRYELLDRSNMREDATSFLDTVLEEYGDEPPVLEWCANETYRATISQEKTLAQVAAAGDMDAYASLVEQLQSGFLESERLYEQLRAVRPDWAGASNGLSAVNLNLHRYQGNGNDIAERLDASVAFAEEAIVKDPAFWESHYNLALARWYRAITEAGGMADLGTNAMQDFVDGMRSALSFNSLMPQPMNDTAVVLGMLAERQDDTVLLAEALMLAKRAVRIHQPDPGTSCSSELNERILESALEDTLGQLLEQAGEIKEALAAAQRSLAALDSVDPGRDKRQATVDRLNALLSGG